MWVLTDRKSEAESDYVHFIDMKFRNDIIREEMEVGVCRRSGKGIRITSHKIGQKPKEGHEWLEYLAFIPLEIIPDVFQAIQEVAELDLTELE